MRVENIVFNLELEVNRSQVSDLRLVYNWHSILWAELTPVPMVYPEERRLVTGLVWVCSDPGQGRGPERQIDKFRVSG